VGRAHRAALHTLDSTAIAVACSADGRHVLVCPEDDEPVRAWDAARGAEEHAHKHQAVATSVAVIPNVVFAGAVTDVYRLDDAGRVLRGDAGGAWRRVCWLPAERRKNGMLVQAGHRV
jgi:hypothetical protein